MVTELRSLSFFVNFLCILSENDVWLMQNNSEMNVFFISLCILHCRSKKSILIFQLDTKSNFPQKPIINLELLLKYGNESQKRKHIFTVKFKRTQQEKKK